MNEEENRKAYLQQALFDFLEKEGYYNLRVIDGVVVGINRFIFTYAIVVGLTYTGYERRYCYKDEKAAGEALAEWTNTKIHPNGTWIKLKGRFNGSAVDLLNPNLNKF